MKAKKKNRGIKATFNWSSNAQKRMVNKLIATHADKTYPAAVLDGPDMKTTQSLRHYGFKQKILIPNSSQDFFKIVQKHQDAYNITFGTFLKMVRKGYITPSPRKFGCVYPDYMCTFGGNRECRPKEDIEFLFKNRMLSDNAVFALTFSLTRIGKQVNGFKNPETTEVLKFVGELAAENGYNAVPVGGGEYRNGGNMFTYVWKMR